MTRQTVAEYACVVAALSWPSASAKTMIKRDQRQAALPFSTCVPMFTQEHLFIPLSTCSEPELNVAGCQGLTRLVRVVVPCNYM